jgi:hypothetical protein
MELEAEKLLEALEAPFADRVRDLQELKARHGVGPDAEGVVEYVALMKKAWLRGLRSA